MNLQALEDAGLEVSTSLGEITVLLPRRVRLLPMGAYTLLAGLAMTAASWLDPAGLAGLLLIVVGGIATLVGAVMAAVGAVGWITERAPRVRRLTGQAVTVSGQVVRFRRRQLPLEDIKAVHVQKTADLARLQVMHDRRWVTVARSAEGRALDAVRRLIEDGRARRRAALQAQGADPDRPARVPRALEAMRER